MPYPRPTLSQLRTQAQSDIGSNSLLRFSNTRVIADILAKGFNGNYGYLDWISKQATPFTAEDEYLEAWAALKQIIRNAAAPGGGTVLITGSPSTPVSSGVGIVRGDGVAFETTSSATIGSGGTATVSIIAVIDPTDDGSQTNSDPGTPFAFSPAIAGVTGATAQGPIVGGADLETYDQLRTRTLAAYAQPPQGGSISDYIGWTSDVAGVTRAWIQPNGMGPGTVICYFMMDSSEAAHAGFPQGSNGVAAAETRDLAATGDQLTVANYLFTKCNVNALVYASAPAPNTINFTISGLSGVGSAVQAAIVSAITAVFLEEGSPGGSTLPNGATAGEVQMSDIEAAINSVSGSAGFVITSASASAGNASATTNITSNLGCLPVLGSITWS